MKLLITTDYLGELHFEGEPKEIFESVKRFFIKICPMEDDKPFTIQDLAAGKCAVENNGMLEQLRGVLKAAFPHSNSILNGAARFYHKWNKNGWIGAETTTLPTQSVADFLQDEFVWGEEVEVFDLGNWFKSNFIGHAKVGCGFICENEHNIIDRFYEIRKLPTKTKLTMQQIAEKFGVDVDNFEII